SQGIAFCHDVFGTWGGCSWVELSSGFVFFINIMMNLHSPLTLRHEHKKLDLVDGRLVARYYAFRNSMWLDILGLLPSVYQFALIMCLYTDTTVSGDTGRAVTLLQV
ncbi:uncharacterized protein HaLaN_30895, partial [Haematococcus lacustris]